MREVELREQALKARQDAERSRAEAAAALQARHAADAEAAAAAKRQAEEAARSGRTIADQLAEDQRRRRLLKPNDGGWRGFDQPAAQVQAGAAAPQAGTGAAAPQRDTSDWKQEEDDPK